MEMKHGLSPCLSRQYPMVALVDFYQYVKRVCRVGVAKPPTISPSPSSRLGHGIHCLRVGPSTLDDWLRTNQITFKKTAHASEQERADVQRFLQHTPKTLSNRRNIANQIRTKISLNENRMRN
jgi:hypothetical protein